MSWLLDTVTVSALFSPDRHPNVVRWLRNSEGPAYISVLTFGEIERGIISVAKKQSAFALRLAAWSRRLQDETGDRILPVDLASALRWGSLSAKLGRNDTDVQNAATALVHDLTIVTRNTRHFAAAGVRVINPWGE